VKRARKLALSLGVFALTAAAVEVGLRVAGFEHPPPPPLVLWDPWTDKVLDSERGIHVRDRECLWVPRPGNPIRRPPIGVPGSDERVNDAGFRGPELAREPAPGTLRIATLGDSSTFGYGVRWQDTYSARLVEELAARGVRAEVLDAGVVGYTAVQGLERYRHDVRPWRPDVVVAAFGAVNDGFDDGFSDREKIAQERARGALDGLARALAERSRSAQLAAWLAERMHGGDGAPRRARVRRVSLDEFRAALAEFAQLADADGAHFVALSMPRRTDMEEERPELVLYTRALEELAREERWPLVDARGAFRTAADEDALLLDAFHPQPEGHGLLARLLAEAIAPDAR
jgi:lysophospholipase L1-like esterase